ncbi:hypothetical protein AV530_015396 [Patagioenas fasciata monilis]|uniref:Uncharacterized protein n=1 Tax=Patagioenas fasciata monilis TaxID=372326 RepID=A0A1V4JWQ0_PATFA|nr:hypothetical protein AV530_015396 [Patagioenas fasciata monilis]
MGQLLLLMALRISLVMQWLKCQASVISLRKKLTTTPEITTFLQLLAKHHKRKENCDEENVFLQVTGLRSIEEAEGCVWFRYNLEIQYRVIKNLKKYQGNNVHSRSPAECGTAHILSCILNKDNYH